jgi:hypothetical protein
MRGIINDTYYILVANQNELDNELNTPQIAFRKGDEVEILKTVDSGGWLDGNFYVVYNEETQEAMTISGYFVDLI